MLRVFFHPNNGVLQGFAALTTHAKKYDIQLAADTSLAIRATWSG